jgi:plastocyanin
MKFAFVLLLCAFVLNARAGAAIEGQVNLALLPKTPVAKPNVRYQNKIDVAAPEPPTAVVYLEGTFAPSTNLHARLEQKNYQFVPAVLPIEKGTTVDFPNRDDNYHSVFTYSKIKRFDLGQYRREEKPASQTFTTPGIVRLYCEIHEHMRGVILVLDTPHFMRTDKDGKYRLENLPAGSYKLKAWLEEKLILEKPVDLKDGETLKVDFTTK